MTGNRTLSRGCPAAPKSSVPPAPACTWEAAPVVEMTGQVAELFSHVPVFSRHPFRVGGEENRFRAEPSCGVAESVIPVYCPLCSSRIVATVRRSW